MWHGLAARHATILFVKANRLQANRARSHGRLWLLPSEAAALGNTTGHCRNAAKCCSNKTCTLYVFIIRRGNYFGEMNDAKRLFGILPTHLETALEISAR